MKKVSGNQHLLRRNSVFTTAAECRSTSSEKIGKQFIQHSLNTTSLAEAKILGRQTPGICPGRPLRRLEGCCGSARVGKVPNHNEFDRAARRRLSSAGPPYVERQDKEFSKRFAGDPPQTEREKARDEDGGRARTSILLDGNVHEPDEWIYHTGKEILQRAGKSLDNPAIYPAQPWQNGLSSRGLLKLGNRILADLC